MAALEGGAGINQRTETLEGECRHEYKVEHGNTSVFYARIYSTRVCVFALGHFMYNLIHNDAHAID